MEIDSFDAVIDQILAFAKGDIRFALRAVLIETVLLQEELRLINATGSLSSKADRKKQSPVT